MEDGTSEIKLVLWKDIANVACSVGHQLSATRLRVTEYTSKLKLQTMWLSTVLVSYYSTIYIYLYIYMRMCMSIQTFVLTKFTVETNDMYTELFAM